MEREERLRRRRDFREAMARGRTAAGRAAVLFVLDGGRGRRMAVAVPRKVGGAVVRNRVRRLVREAYRRWRPQVRPGLDLVFLARPEAARLAFAEVLAAVGELLRRAGAMAGASGAAATGAGAGAPAGDPGGGAGGC